MFAGFCVYAYRKFIRYEEDGAPELPADADSITEIPRRTAAPKAYGPSHVR